MFKPNGKQQSDFRTERFYRYGIRKYSFGAASVAIATGLMFLGNGAVSANTTESSVTEATTSTSSESGSSSSEASSTVASEVPTVAASSETTEVASNALEVKEVEAPKAEAKATADKSGLQAKIAELETRLAQVDRAKAPASTLSVAEKALAEAKTVAANADATQEQVDAATKAVNTQSGVVATMPKASATTTEKVAEAKPAEKATAETTVAPAPAATTAPAAAAEKTVEAQKAELVQVQADLNNYLPQAEKVNANSPVIAQAKAALATVTATIANANITVADLEKRVQEAKRTRNSLVNLVTGSNSGSRDSRNGQAMEEGSQLLTPADFYADATANSDGTRTTHADAPSSTNHTGRDIYTFNADGTVKSGGAGELNKVTRLSGGTAEGLEIVIYSNQRTGEETNPSNGLSSSDGGREGHNNMGRMDYPLSAADAEKLAKEANLWRGKLRPSGSTIGTSGANVFSNNGGFEFLATEIYGLVYEQGIDRVYIPGIKARFGVTESAANAGWELTSVSPANMPSGLVYDATNDVIEGIISNGNENGVQDLRVTATFTNKTTGAVMSTLFQNMRMGWIGWMDTTPPVIATDQAVYERTVGEDVNIDINYQDASAARTLRSQGAGVSYTKADGTTTTIRQTYITATTGIAGVNTNNNTSILDENSTTIPGVSYRVNASGRGTLINVDGQQTYTGAGQLSGALTEAGVYTVSTYAKDFNDTSGSSVQWRQSGQETQGELTVIVKPKVEVLNIETYSKEVPVTISKGATNAFVTMPDGTKTVLQNQNGKWVVVASGVDVNGNTITTTNTAATAGTDLGTVGDQIKIPVTQDATAKAGVDNVTVEAITENIKGTFLRNSVTLTDVDGSTHEATLSKTTGHWELPADYATVQTTNADGTYKLTKRQVYTEAQMDGSMNFYIYSYTRTFENDGTVKSVDEVTRHKTEVAGKNSTSADGMSVTVTYDKFTDTWTASDGSTVTATELGENSWVVRTSTGFGGEIKGRKAGSSDVGTIINARPTASSASYESTLGTTVDLRNAASAAVTIADKEDDANDKTTYITRLTVTSPSGSQKVYDTKTDADAYNLASDYVLNEVGVYTIVVDVIDSNGNIVTADLNGTNSGTDAGAGSSTATTTYTITVKANIVGTNVTSQDIQGAVQTGQPTFTFDDADKSAIESGTKVYALESTDATDANGNVVGTYAIDDNGLVTFTPKSDFTGTPTPAKVTLTVTIDGIATPLTATATYTPTVLPVTPTAVASKTSGPQGKAQTSEIKFDAADTDDTTVNFAKGTVVIDANTTKSVDLDTATVTLLNAAGEKVTSVTVDGEGTYTLNGTTITFQPLATFTGQATPVEVQVEDKNGTVAKTTYTPTVTDVTMTSEDAASSGIQGATQTGTPTFTTSSDEVGIKSVKLVDPATGNPTDATSVTVENEGTYTIDPSTGTVTFVPVPSFTGVAKGVSVQATDDNDETATAKYTPTVNPVSLTHTDVTSKDIQGQEQNGTPTFTLSEGADVTTKITGYKLVDPATGTSTDATSVTVANVGTYTIDQATGAVTFKPEASYTGTPDAIKVEATATVTNANNVTATITDTASYTPTVVGVTPTAVASETTGVQGQTQTSAIKFDAADEDKTTVNFAKGTTTVNDVEKSVDLATATVTLLDENGAATNTVTVAGQGTYTLNGTTISFQPEASFVGKADGVKVRVADANGTTATTTYTPTVTDVTMTSEDATSKDIQGQEQSGTPTFETSDSSVTIAKRELIDPTTNQPTTTVTIDNEGTYTIDPTTGKVTFVPVPTFTGPGTGVTVQATDSNGETATAKYTPTVVPVTPTAVASETTGVQGQTQTSAIKFDAADEDKTTVNFAKGTTTVNDVEKSVDLATATVTLLDENGAATNTVTVAGQGTYTLNGTTISFQPEASFVGKADGVKVRVADANGTTATTTYTPTVTDVTLSSEDAASSAIQGATQTGTPTFTTSSDEVGIKSVKLVDPATGNPTDATSVTVEGEGTYTIDPSTGTVTFVPVPSFTGVAKGVTVQATDDNDETVTAKYTPTVTPVTLSHTDVTSKDIQGQEQNGTPTFTLSEGAEDTTKITGYKLVDPSTGTATDDTSVTVTGVGTYTIDPTTGKVTFSPNSDYTGTPAAIQVEATATVTNANNETATITEKASYTPTVVPAKPTAKESATSGKQGKPQTSEIKVNSDDSDAKTVNFANGTADVDGVTKSVELNVATITLLDANGDQATSVTVDGQGTYTLNGTTITFQPTEDFVDEATPVQVRITDANGSSVTTTYTPTVIAEDGSVVVEYVDEDGNPLSDTETVVPNATVGTEYNTTAKSFTGYTLTETPSNANGKVTDGLTTVTYVYKKNDQVATITYKDVTDATNEVQLGDVDTVNGKFSDTIEYTTEARIKALEKAGYELVTDGFTTDEGRVYDADNSANNYVVTLKQRTLPVVPTDVTPVPGEPVDPTDPDSPVWPNTDAVKNIETSKTVTRTIKYRYIDQNGQEASADVVQTVTFTRTANVNLVTGTVTYGDWSADETLAAVTSPSIANYSVDTASVASTTVTPDSEDSTVYVIYTPLAPTSTPATSTDIQGKEQTGTPSFKHADGTDLKPSTTNPAKFVGTTETTIPATKDGQPVGTYTIDPATGTVTFTPNKDFVGTPDPATVEVTDPTNGQTTTATYTPTVTPVTPTGVDTTSVGPKNTPQSGTPTFVPGNREVPMDDDTPATFEDGTTTKEVPNVGTFTVAKDGTVTFTPVNNYVGTPEGVVVVRKDINGTEAKAKYTPTVISEDGSVIAKFVDEDGKQLTDTTVVVENEETGTSYTTAPKTIPGYVLKETPANATGTVSNGLTTVTYVYEKATQNATITYVDVTTGTEKVLGDVDSTSGKFDEAINYSTEARIKALEKAGYELVTDGFTTEAGRVYDADDAKNNFKVSVKEKVVPTDVTPVPGQPVNPNDPDSPVWPDNDAVKNIETSKTVTRTIKYRYIDENGQEASADVVQTVTFTRTANVNLVTGTVTYGDWSADETLAAVTSPGIDGYTTATKSVAATTVTPNSEDSTVYVIYTATETPAKKVITSFVDEEGKELSPKEDGAKSSKTIPGYEIVKSEIDTDGNITHVYRKVTTTITSFVDEDGTPVSPQEDGSQPSKTITGYELVKSSTDKDGNVTHVYRKVAKTITSFVDEDGTPVSPNEEGNQPSKTITGYELVKSSTDKDGNVTHVYRKVKTTITSFVDEDGTPVSPNEEGNQPSKTITGYELVKSSTDKDGNVTHVYRKVAKTITSFVDEDGTPVSPNEEGNQPSKTITGYELVKSSTDKDGNVTHVYRKVAKTTTSFVDESGKELSPKEDGVKSSKTISGYELVKTEIDKDGNVTHVYKPVVKTTTSFVDGNGNPIPGTTTEDGEQPKKDIPGYEYVRTEKDPNGNTKHIYKVVTPTTKTTTSFVDGNGNPIPGTTTEDGEQPKKDIPGYEYVRTEKDPNGNTKHIYKVVTPTTKTTTSFVDENGTPVSPNEDGNQPAKAIPGYELISSTTDKDGNVTHVYRKVATPSKTTTSFVDENGNPIRPNKDGNQGAEKIPGYVLVKTTVDANGNTIHTYAKLQPTTPAPAKKVAQRPVAKGAKQLPNTGTESSAGLAALGLAGLLGGLGLASRKKKED